MILHLEWLNMGAQWYAMHAVQTDVACDAGMLQKDNIHLAARLCVYVCECVNCQAVVEMWTNQWQPKRWNIVRKKGIESNAHRKMLRCRRDSLFYLVLLLPLHRANAPKLSISKTHKITWTMHYKSYGCIDVLGDKELIFSP